MEKRNVLIRALSDMRIINNDRGAQLLKMEDWFQPHGGESKLSLFGCQCGVYQKAKEQGLGGTIPTDSFLQDIRDQIRFQGPGIGR